VHCTRCGHQNPEGSRFCAQCGAALSQERVGEATSVIPKVGGEDSGEAPEVTEATADAHAGAVESLPAGSALLAWYTATAMMLEGTYRRPVLPLGRRGAARRPEAVAPVPSLYDVGGPGAKVGQ
jgi:zinc-ribbon domain